MAAQVTLVNGPFDGVEIDEPSFGTRSVLIGTEKEYPLVARYRKAADGKWLFDSYDKVLLSIPVGD